MAARIGLGAGLALALGGSAGAAYAGAQTFPVALPIAQGEIVQRHQLFYRQADADPSARNRKLAVLGTKNVVAVGITGRTAAFAALPIARKRLKLTRNDGTRITRTAKGIGDLRLLGRYTAYRRDGTGWTARVAPYAGLELPTGASAASDQYGRLPQPLQLGSGAVDALVGVTATWQGLAYKLGGRIGYKANRPAHDFQFGNVARADANLQLRLWPRSLGSGVPAFILAGVEANLIHRAKNRRNGAPVADSGGTRLFLAPTLQTVARRWVAEAAVQLPAWESLNGAALGGHRIVRAGLRVNF